MANGWRGLSVFGFNTLGLLIGGGAFAEVLFNEARQVSSAPLSDPVGYAMLEYSMRELPAFYIFRPRGEQVGDSYKLRQFDVLPRASDCFDSVSFSEINTPLTSRETKFTTDLSAALKLVGSSGLFGLGGEADVSVIIKTHTMINFEGAARIHMLDRRDFIESATEYSGANEDCVRLRMIFDTLDVGNTMYNAPPSYVPIQELFFANGNVETFHELTIDGALSAGSRSALQSFLSRLGLGLSVDVAIEAGLVTTSKSNRPFFSSVPFAFVPFYISELDYVNVSNILANSELSAWLDSAVYSTDEIIEILQKNPQLRRRVFEIGQFPLLGPEGPFDGDVSFISYNSEEHGRYLRARSQIALIQRHLLELGVDEEIIEKN